MPDDVFGAHLPRLQLGEDEFTQALRAAGLSRGERYLEPGSGEGVGLVVAARDFEAHARGIELHPASVERAIERAERERVDIVVATGDLRDHVFGDADVVLLYLGPAFHDLLADRLASELAPGSRVVSWGWQVPGWLPDPASDQLAQAWIYRPADPACQASWHQPDLTITAGGDPLLAAVSFAAHAQLTDLGVGVEVAAGPAPNARVCATSLQRGQSAWVEVEWAGRPAPGVTLQLTSAGAPVGRPLTVS